MIYTLLAQVSRDEITTGVGSALNPLSSGSSSLTTIAWNIVKSLFDVAVFGFLLAFLVAGAYILFSAGSDESIEKGKKSATYALIGLIVVFFGDYLLTTIAHILEPAISSQSIATVTSNIFQYILALSGAVFLLMLLFGGVRYLTAGGNEEATAKAKKQLVTSFVGLALVAFSFAIAKTILTLLNIVQ